MSRRGWQEATAVRPWGGVHKLLLGGMRASRAAIVTRLSQVIDRLSGTMEEQEREVFEMVENKGTVGPEIPAAISGGMSVNEILQRYPQTEQVFERLRINRWWEGYESVDELAWRHGMDVSDVVEQLRQIALSSNR